MCTAIMYVDVFQCVDTSVSKSLIFETEGVLACVRVFTKDILRLIVFSSEKGKVSWLQGFLLFR
jgi:hypothetical protein